MSEKDIGQTKTYMEVNIKMDLQESGKGLWGLDGVGSG
jgi:hypothetical protein